MPAEADWLARELAAVDLHSTEVLSTEALTSRCGHRVEPVRLGGQSFIVRIFPLEAAS